MTFAVVVVVVVILVFASILTTEAAIHAMLCALERLQMAKGKQQDRTEIVNVHIRDNKGN